MNCPEFQERLQNFLDGPAAARDLAALQAHAEECAPCRGLWKAAERLQQGLTLLKQESPPAEFAVQVVNRIRRQRRRTVILRWTAAAAAVLLTVITIWAVQGYLSFPQQPQPNLVSAPPESREASAPIVAIPSLPNQARETGKATIDLTVQLAQDTAREAKELMPPMASPALTSSLDPGTLPMREVGQTVSDGFEPIVKSTRRAFDVWIDILPGTTEDKSGS